MSVTVTQELTQQTVTVTGNPVENNVTVTVSNARGPAGEGGGGSNSITSATTSDGTADLSLLNVTTATAEVTGTLTASHIHGNLAGSVYAHVRAGEALAKGDPVYVSGSHGSGSTLIAEVSKADASNAAKMPAVGVMDADVANNASGHMVIIGTITELDTSAYSVNAELYVASGGGFTATPPTARAQPVARVERANANNGAVIVKVNGLITTDGNANPGDVLATDGAGEVTVTSLFAANVVDATNGTLDNLFVDLETTYAATATWFYDVGAAAVHRTALGLGATGSIAASDPLTVTQTWTDAATTYTGLQVNVTDTDSNAASLLMDLQVGGVSKFSVDKTGGATSTFFRSPAGTTLNLRPAGGNTGVVISGSGTGTILLQRNSDTVVTINNDGLILTSLRHLSWSSDLFLFRDAANTLAQRNGIGQPQAFRLYNTYSSSTNFERLNFRWDSNVAKIGTEKGSAGGTARDLVLETDGTERVRVRAAGAVTMGGTLAVTGAISSSASISTTAGIIAGQNQAFSFSGRSRMFSSADGTMRLTNAAISVGVTLDFATDGTLKIRSQANSADANLTAANLTASGTVQTGGYTFATLPTPATGMRAYITDGASSPVYMANAAGGGSTVTPVFYNGTNWINA